MMDYYNFYQPTRYSAYYNNLYNYQQYQVTRGDTPNPCWLSIIAMITTVVIVIIIVNKNNDVILFGGLYTNTK